MEAWVYLLIFLLFLFFIFPVFGGCDCGKERYANQILHGVAGGIGGPISMVDLPSDCIPRRWGGDEYPGSGYPPHSEGYEAEQSVDDPSIYGGIDGYGDGSCGSCRPFLGPNPYRQARV
jgi:hypothetical protein